MRKVAVPSILCAVMLLAVAVITEAQQSKKVPRIGYLAPVFPCSGSVPSLEAFRQGLRDLGYVEDRNIITECRSAGGKLDRQSDGLRASSFNSRLMSSWQPEANQRPVQPSKRPRPSPSS